MRNLIVWLENGFLIDKQCQYFSVFSDHLENQKLYSQDIYCMCTGPMTEALISYLHCFIIELKKLCEIQHDIHGTIVLSGKIRSHATLSNIFRLAEIK